MLTIVSTTVKIYTAIGDRKYQKYNWNYHIVWSLQRTDRISFPILLNAQQKISKYKFYQFSLDQYMCEIWNVRFTCPNNASCRI